MGNLNLLILLVPLLIIWLLYRQLNRRQSHIKWPKENSSKNIYQHHKIKQKKSKKLSRDYVKEENKKVGITNSLNNLPPLKLQQFNLIQPGKLDEETLAEAVKIIDGIKRPHPALQTLTKNLTTENLIETIKGCPDITAKIIATVNSAAFGVQQQITSINHAIIYLGINLVKSIAMNFIIKQNFSETGKYAEKAYKRLWSCSYLSSSLSFLMAQTLSKVNAAELSSKSLLNSIGSLALAAYDEELAELYYREPSLLERVEFEQKKYGLNSSIIGSLLAKKWKLPDTIADNISFCHFPLKYGEQPMDLNEQAQHDVIFCYFLNRVSDEIIYHQLPSFNNLGLDKGMHIDMFYMQQALIESNLTNCINYLNNPDFIHKADQLIKQAR